MDRLCLAIVGATGAVGQELLKVIEERDIPFTELRMLASKNSEGKKIIFKGKEYVVEVTTEDSFSGVDLALFAGGPASREFGRLAQKKGTVVIDNSSTFRYDSDVPLVVPEINASDLDNHQGLIANPNCSTIIMGVPLYPLYLEAGIKRIIVSTYQAVSGAGKEAIDELNKQTKDVLDGKKAEPDIFKYQIAFNLIPHIDVWEENGYTKEEMKMVKETHKIFHDNSIAITATTVRVPVFRSHSESIFVETERHLSVEEVRSILKTAPGVVLQDEISKDIYPMPITATDTDDVYVGRIRKDLYTPNGINLWVAADQIRKGAATNTVQIAEELIKRKLI